MCQRPPSQVLRALACLSRIVYTLPIGVVGRLCQMSGSPQCKGPAMPLLTPSPPQDTPLEHLAGSVERVIFHSEETGFCVLRVKVRGHRDLITVVRTAP